MFLQYDILSDNIGLYSNYNLSYSPSGRIGNKTCDDMLWDYWYGYKNSNNGRPTSHQVRSIYDLYNDNTSFLQWDANGQLQAVVRPCTGDMRHHWWNEAGQMVASIDNASCGYYGYDGNGNRAYKLTGQSAQDQYNAGEWQYHVDFNDAVLYVNPYFIVTPKGYTRHYYNGSMHIASQIGNILDLPTNIIDTSAVARERIANAQAYMASILDATTEKIDISTGDIADIDGDELDELQWQCLDTNSIAFRITLHSDTNMLFPALNRDAGFPANVLDIYYYHADHLGSASWITNSQGQAVQYIHYMPYGELWVNQQANSYDERFKFTGKERDTESGYDYFGARYYSSMLNHWTSPDKKSDEYPHISSYAYCNWNPMKNVDPNGKEVINKMDSKSQNSDQRNLYTAALNFQDNPKQNQIFYIAHGNQDRMYPVEHMNDGIDAQGFVDYIKNNSELWNVTEDKSCLSIVLLSCETGKGENSIAEQISKLLPEVSVIAPNEEVKAVTYGEPPTSIIYGVYKKDAKTSQNLKDENSYGGQWIEFKGGNKVSQSIGASIKYVYKNED